MSSPSLTKFDQRVLFRYVGVLNDLLMRHRLPASVIALIEAVYDEDKLPVAPKGFPADVPRLRRDLPPCAFDVLLIRRGQAPEAIWPVLCRYTRHYNICETFTQAEIRLCLF